MSLHQQQVHPDFVEGCFGCKVSTLAVTLPKGFQAQKN